jgi:hypothetical protein
VELPDVTGRRLVAEAAGDLWSKSADGAALARATCGRSRPTALRWPGALRSKSADGAALAGRLVVEVGCWRSIGDCWECCSALRVAR